MELQNEHPQQLSRGTFLGIRRESGIMRKLMSQTRGEVSLGSSMNALMPDGGLSPCVIKVLGVGGGGSNAVSLCLV
jgi:cell division protein FtsZ